MATIGDGKNVPARLHRADVIGDVFGGAKPIHAALTRFKADGRGVIVYLRDGTAGVPVAEIPHDGDTGTDAARSRQWREIGLGAQILKDLGISSIRLLASSKRTYVGLGGFGIEIVGDRADRRLSWPVAGLASHAEFRPARLLRPAEKRQIMPARNGWRASGGLSWRQ